MNGNKGNIRICAGCGRQFPAMGQFCPWCGSPAGNFSETVNGLISWDITISIFSNPTILKQLAIIFGAAIFLLVLFMFVLGVIDGTIDSDYLIFLGKLFIFMFLGFGAMTALGVLIFMGNKYAYNFTIEAGGITEETQPRQRRRNTFINTLTGILALFARNPGAMGAAVLAQSRQKQFVGWKDINRVEGNPGRREIILKKNGRVRMAVYCHAENYETVYEMIKRYAGGK